MKQKVAEYIADFLVSHNMNDCFVITGGGAMHLNDALGHHEGINCIFNHHEQASAMAAEGYARITERMAPICVTSGPGGTNALTGVMGAWVDSIPMFVISGQVKREATVYSQPKLNLRQLGDQEFDIVKAAETMCKYAAFVDKEEDIAYHLEKAYYLALDGRMGPVWLDVPLDVQGAIIETEKLRHFKPEAEIASKNSEICHDPVDAGVHITEKIRKAKSPIFLAGSGIRFSQSQDLLLKVLEKFQIPVLTAWNSGDLVAYDNPYFAGMPGTVGTRAGNFALQNADLVISLGCRMNIRMIGYTHFDFGKNAELIAIDIDEGVLQVHKLTFFFAEGFTK